MVKRLGDGLMAAFWDVPSAVDAAFVAGERVAPIEVGGYRPLLRTGIHLGRPRKLAPGAAEAKRRRFSAKGAPKGMDAYAVKRREPTQPPRG